MSAVQVVEAPRLTITDDDVTHWVCHCTDDTVAACGLDMTDTPFNEDDNTVRCPLCYLAWPDDAPTCPWGCSCDDECGPDEPSP